MNFKKIRCKMLSKKAERAEYMMQVYKGYIQDYEKQADKLHNDIMKLIADMNEDDALNCMCEIGLISYADYVTAKAGGKHE